MTGGHAAIAGGHAAIAGGRGDSQQESSANMSSWQIQTATNNLSSEAAMTTSWKVRPSNLHERLEYQRQESLR